MITPCCENPEYVRYVQIWTWNTAELIEGKLRAKHDFGDGDYGDEVDDSEYFECAGCGQKVTDKGEPTNNGEAS